MTGIDTAILAFIQTNICNAFLDPIMVFVTYLGNVGAVWIILAGVLLLKKETRVIGITMLVALALSALLTELVIKPLVARPRPCSVDTSVALLINRPTDYSFPSGHTSASFAAVTVLFLFRKRWWIPSLVLAILIAFSRLYLFVHFPTDVLAGALLGILCGVVAFALSRRGTHASQSCSTTP